MAHAPIGMILAAGFGTRLHPLSLFRPKPAMEIAAKPIIYHLIKQLENAGIKDIIINLHYKGDQIKNIVSNYSFKSRIHFVYEPIIYNTAGGLANALRVLDISKRPMVLMHGDIFCDFAIEKFLYNDYFCTLICDENRNIEGYQGSVGVDAQDAIVELGKFYGSDNILTRRRGFFTGIQFLSAKAIDLIKNCTNQSLVKDIYPSWLKEGLTIKGVVTPLSYDDLGTPKRIFHTNMSILKNSSDSFTHHYSDMKKSNDSYIHEDVTIHKSAKLYGPLIIAKGVEIKAHAQVGPCVILGERSIVSEHSLVKECIIMSDTVIEKKEAIQRIVALKSARVSISEG